MICLKAGVNVLRVLSLITKHGGRVSSGCSQQLLLQKVGVACPQGALNIYLKTVGVACPQGALKYDIKKMGVACR
jgi:hypothetical protein